jgi:N-acyl homoserine lactone hydrolase
VPLDLAPEPIGAFAASKRLTKDGDVIAVATPGHTAGHISVLVFDGDVIFLLAGDTSYTEHLMVAGRVDGVCQNAAIARTTLRRISRFALERPTIYLPTHDPGSGTRLAARQLVRPSGPANA